MDVREKQSSEKRLIDYYYLAEKIECPGEPLVYWYDIEAAPTVDAVEVVHGRWIESACLYYGAKQYECSLCHSDTFWRKHSITVKYPYCPNCGCRMDGGDDE